MSSLAVKYRPKEFKDVCSQEVIVKILEKQLELNQIPNCILFCGGSGTGKTTLARILANKINNNCGLPIEIDAASNNGVDNIRNIINDSRERSLDGDYKVYIIDEAHMITTQGWNAFLKCLEEPPKYTIFLFCTTDPQKIPSTIQSRMMRFNLSIVSTTNIKQRLMFICNQENILFEDTAIDYISKISNGGMRKAISNLEKVILYSNNVTLNNCLKVLGNYSYDILFELTNSIIDCNNNNLISILNGLNSEGCNFKVFIDQYIDFILDACKYCITQDINVTKIPLTELESLKFISNIENNIKYYKWLLDKLFDLKELIKFESNAFNTIMIKLLQLIRGN